MDCFFKGAWEPTKISKEDIEKKRTPTELRDYVQETRRRVEANADERKRALRKTGLYKTFVDEVMPLAICADHLCEPDDRILPVLGNPAQTVLRCLKNVYFEGQNTG